MLADMLGVSKPMMTAHITALMKKDYVTKVPSPADGRACYILPTDKARKLVASVQQETDAQLRHIMTALGPAEFDSLVSLITRTNHIMEEYEHGHQR